MKPITCLVTATVLVIVATAACSTGTQVEAERALRDGCADWNTSISFRVAEVSDVTRCLQAGADPNARDESGSTPLHAAAMSATGEAVTALLEAGADPKALDASGTTPLHDAVSAEVVAALLEAGADMEAGDPHGMTPLDHAARGGRAEVVAALLEAGADLEERNAYEMTPLDHAVMASGRCDHHVLPGPCEYPEVVAALLEAGADMEADDAYGMTPLHWAVWGTAEVVTALLDAGADPNARNSTGAAPLHAAVVWGTAEVVTALLEAGADPNARDGTGRLAIDNASDNEYLKGTDAYRKLNPWRFRPGMRNGEPVDVEIKIEVNFNRRPGGGLTVMTSSGRARSKRQAASVSRLFY